MLVSKASRSRNLLLFFSTLIYLNIHYNPYYIDCTYLKSKIFTSLCQYIVFNTITFSHIYNRKQFYIIQSNYCYMSWMASKFAYFPKTAAVSLFSYTLCATFNWHYFLVCHNKVLYLSFFLFVAHSNIFLQALMFCSIISHCCIKITHKADVVIFERLN